MSAGPHPAPPVPATSTARTMPATSTAPTVPATSIVHTADEDAAAVLVVLAALAARTVEPTVSAPRSVWQQRGRRRAPGADAWWASGLPR